MGSGWLILLGQSVVGTAGGDTSGPGGTVGFSIGQVVYTNLEGESGNINQGVQQPYDILMVSNSEPWIDLKASIFPNPTVTSVQLVIEDIVYSSGTGVFTYALYDPSGRILQQHEIMASSTMITLEKLAGSVYFLRVSFNDREVKTFKLFKTN
jgi:hypothetical protein